MRYVHQFDFDLWIDVKNFEKGFVKSLKWHLLAFQYKGSHGKPRDGSLEIGDTNRFCKENDWFDKSFSQSQQKREDFSFFLIWPKNGRRRSRSLDSSKVVNGFEIDISIELLNNRRNIYVILVTQIFIYHLQSILLIFLVCVISIDGSKVQNLGAFKKKKKMKKKKI